MYPQFVPENAAVPAIAYSMVSDQATMVMTGVAGVRNPRIQISIVAKTQPDVTALSEKIKVRINSWNATYPDMRVSECFCEGGVYLSLDYYTPPKFGMIVEAYLNWNPIP
jgi:hypothetical protein